MRIGYACINMTMPSKFKTCRLKTVELEGMEKVKELALHNLNETLRVIEWNIAHDLYFYRMSSDLIPFATHPVMTWDWAEDADVQEVTKKIKQLQQQHNLRLSVHPGQYTLINSPNAKVVRKAILDLRYHAKLLTLTGGTDMILHLGGVYGDKEAAKSRFISAYGKLPADVRSYLRIENDDKLFTIDDVLEICETTGAAACFDIHHHACHHEEGSTVAEAMEKAFHTWIPLGIPPKMHISSGKTSKTDRAHHTFIFEDDWRYLIDHLPHSSVDVMVEAKMKEQAALEIIHHFQ